jgi:hypothetical protein
MCDCSSLVDDGDAEPDEPGELDELELLLQAAASSATARPAVAATAARPRRGDLIDAPIMNNGRRPCLVKWRRLAVAGDKAGPPRAQKLRCHGA